MFAGVKIKKLVYLTLLGTIALSGLASEVFAGRDDETAGTAAAPAGVQKRRSLDFVMDIARVLRSFPRGLSSTPQEIYAHPHEDLLPFAQHIEQFLDQYQRQGPTHNSFVEPLIQEVRNLIGHRTVNMTSLWEVCVRFAIAIHPQTEEERLLSINPSSFNVFDDYARKQGRIFINKIFKWTSWFCYNTSSDEEMSASSDEATGNEEGGERLHQRIFSCFPIPVFCPLLGEEDIDIPLYVRYVSGNIFPIRIPVRPLSVGGAVLSPWGVTLKDFSIQFPDSLLTTLAYSMQSYPQASSKTFQEHASTIALKKYRVLRDTLREILRPLGSLQERDRQGYAKGMLGMYHVLYSPNYGGNWKDTNLRYFLNQLFPPRAYPKSEVDRFLKTSPQTGESPRTDDEIIAWARQRNLLVPYSYRHFGNALPVPIGSVERNAFLIGVHFQVDDTGGYTSTYYSTLLLKRKQLLEEIKLLSLAYPIDPPDFTAEDILRAQQQVNEAKEDCGRYLHDYVWRNVTGLLEERFREQMTRLEQQLLSSS